MFWSVSIAQYALHTTRTCTVRCTINQKLFYIVFHKKPEAETSCYNFKKTALISKKTFVQAIYTYD